MKQIISIFLCVIGCLSCQNHSNYDISIPQVGNSHYEQSNNSIEAQRHATESSRLELDHFTLGSSFDDVFNVMGNPTNYFDLYTETIWYYDLSTVSFRRGHVTGWDNYRNNLKVKLETSDSTKDHFAIGDSQYSVASVMGTPSKIMMAWNEVWWNYKNSRIVFKDGKVKEWSDISNVLKTKPQLKYPQGINSEIDDTVNKNSKVAISHGPSLQPKLPQSSRSSIPLPQNSLPSLSDEYVSPHSRSGTFVKGYYRSDGTYVSPHYRSGSGVRGHFRSR